MEVMALIGVAGGGGKCWQCSNYGGNPSPPTTYRRLVGPGTIAALLVFPAPPPFKGDKHCIEKRSFSTPGEALKNNIFQYNV